VGGARVFDFVPMWGFARRSPYTAAAESLSPLRARLQNAPIHPPGLPQAGLMSSLEPLLEGGIGLRLPSVSKVAQALQHVLV
jgi:hypothetical protein